MKTQNNIKGILEILIYLLIVVILWELFSAPKAYREEKHPMSLQQPESSKYETINIHQIRAKSSEYIGEFVVLKGKVYRTGNTFLVFYEIVDSSGCITVIPKTNTIPEEGSDIEIRAKVVDLFDGYSFQLLGLEEIEVKPI